MRFCLATNRLLSAHDLSDKTGSSERICFEHDAFCRSFDADGDGYGRGEGFASIIIVPSNALPPETPSYAIINGSAVNQAMQLSNNAAS